MKELTSDSFVARASSDSLTASGTALANLSSDNYEPHEGHAKENW